MVVARLLIHKRKNNNKIYLKKVSSFKVILLKLHKSSTTMTNVHQERPKRPNVASQKLPVAMNHCYCRRGAKQSERIKRLLKNVKNDTRTSKTSIIGIQSYAEKMIRVSNHLLSIVFRFFHSQKLIGSLGIVDNKLIFVSVLKVFCLLDRFSHTLKTTALSFRSPDYIRDASTFVGHVAHLIRGVYLGKSWANPSRFHRPTDKEVSFGTTSPPSNSQVITRIMNHFE